MSQLQRMLPSSGEPGRSFRGLREKRGVDQEAAIIAGYDSTAEWAIDILAERLIALEGRVKMAEGELLELLTERAEAE